MRIELVIDVPDVHNASLDVVRYGEEAARLVRNDSGQDAFLVHAAVGSAEAIVVPRDYNEEAPVRHESAVAYDPTHPYANVSTPHNEDRDDNFATPPFRGYDDEESEVVAEPEPEVKPAPKKRRTKTVLVEEEIEVDDDGEDEAAAE